MQLIVLVLHAASTEGAVLARSVQLGSVRRHTVSDRLSRLRSPMAAADGMPELTNEVRAMRQEIADLKQQLQTAQQAHSSRMRQSGR